MPLLVQEAFASESGHFYTRSGEAAYTVIGKNGKPRPTTVRDARKLDLVPSVTTITKVAARPGLEKWLLNQVLLSALTLPRRDGESLDAFAARAMIDSREQSMKAAERGSSLHGALEGVARRRSFDPSSEWHPHCVAVQEALAGAGIDLFAGEPEKSFASPLGYGGKLDWNSYAAVLDFKSKPRIEPGAKFAWPEHVMQLAAYDQGLDPAPPPGRRLINVFIGVEDAKV